MAHSPMLAVLLLAASINVEAVTLGKVKSAAAASVNPIRKVTTLLQGIEKKVTEEIAAKEKLYDEYMCYCKTSDGTLAASISETEGKIPKVASNIESDIAKKAQTEAELKSAQVGRVEAKGQIASAEKLRASEAEKFDSESTDLKTNIAALSKAIPAIESGMSGAFLQTSGASTLRRISESNINISPSDRDLLASFLSVNNQAGYVPQSGEITGILKTIKDDMEAELADITATEKGSITDFEGLIAAKKKEIAALTKAIETKSVLIGELGVAIAQQENDLENTKESLAEDKSFLANLDENCATKKSEWEEFQKMSNEELVALADTVKVLNDDDALELFKKTLPAAGSSFMQVQMTSRALRQQALSSLTSHDESDPRFELIQMALQGKQTGFDKIIKMIDSLMAELKKDQMDDDAKKAYCEDQFDIAEDKKKGLEQDMSDLEKKIDDGEEGISTLKSEIADLKKQISELDEQVAEATKTRKEEHDDFVETIAGNKAAKEILAFAMNRLNKFYNPNLYVAPPKVEVAEFAQTGAAPPPPPEADLSYKKKSATKGVISMIDTIIKDLDKEDLEMKGEEKGAQSMYEKFMADAAEKRATMSKASVDKESALAETETDVMTAKDSLKGKKGEVMDLGKYVSSLHGECDWLLKYHDTRAAARTGEIESLDKAKAVLSGADYSLIQVEPAVHLRGALRA
mmetsp:Transcript_52242/g.90751  ORF Transcript_52242/g.90751 Transcript_52242/m.90751 type:complete len:692 (-) Transcript_52242:40-2115(-)